MNIKNDTLHSVLIKYISLNYQFKNVNGFFIKTINNVSPSSMTLLNVITVPQNAVATLEYSLKST